MDDRFHRFSSVLTFRAALLALQMKPLITMMHSSACPTWVRNFTMEENKTLKSSPQGSIIDVRLLKRRDSGEQTAHLQLSRLAEKLLRLLPHHCVVCAEHLGSKPKTLIYSKSFKRFGVLIRGLQNFDSSR